jgi:RHS repeat-associated protein
VNRPSSGSEQAFTDSFDYDANGNMTCRTESGVTYKQEYNAENRISSIQKLASGTCAAPGNLTAKWDFTYDGDGIRTGHSYTSYTDGQPQPAVITRYYFGGAYETRSDGTWKKYYSFAGQTVAMRDAEGFKYFLTDHLGSVSVVLDENGEILEQQRYLPFGQPRVMPPYASVASADYTYTGQRDFPDTGLMDYKARFYSPALGRFIQPDTIVPNAANPQSWNRYSYVRNNPIRYNDPSGHKEACDDPETCKVQREYRKLGAVDFWKKRIKDKFGIEMKDSSNRSWSATNLITANNALSMINDKLNGNLKTMVGGTTFTMESQAQCTDKDGKKSDCYHGLTTGTGITFYSSSSNLHIPIVNFLHESGHLLDAVPSTLDVFSDPFRSNKGGATPTWVKDGYVNRDLLGNMFTQPVQAKPMNEPNSPNEYWADAFANYVANNIKTGPLDPTGEGQQMYDYVYRALYPYANP